jgi:hypothetical protein
MSTRKGKWSNSPSLPAANSRPLIVPPYATAFRFFGAAKFFGVHQISGYLISSRVFFSSPFTFHLGERSCSPKDSSRVPIKSCGVGGFAGRLCGGLRYPGWRIAFCKRASAETVSVGVNARPAGFTTCQSLTYRKKSSTVRKPSYACEAFHAHECQSHPSA